MNNLSTKALSELGDGVAHSTWTLAKSKTGFYEDGSFRAKVRAKAAAPTAVAGPIYEGHHAVR